VFGLLYGFFFEFIQEFNRAYSVESRILPRLFGVVPLDNILGHFMMSLLIFTFYEHFINPKTSNKISRYVWLPIVMASAASVIAVMLYYLNPNLIKLSYSYLIFGCIAVIPPIVLAYKNPRYAREFSLMIPYFFILFFVIEIIAVRHSWWIYPGDQYVGWVQLGDLRYPFEELLFWMLFYAATLVSYYKIFVDRD